MSILIDSNTKVIVQGLTGKTGSFHTNQALDYFGTQMVAGTHPRKAGESWTADNGAALPIYANAADAKDATPVRAAARTSFFILSSSIPRAHMLRVMARTQDLPRTGGKAANIPDCKPLI